MKSIMEEFYILSTCKLEDPEFAMYEKNVERERHGTTNEPL